MALPQPATQAAHGSPPSDNLPIPEAFQAPIGGAPAPAPQAPASQAAPVAASQSVVIGDRTFASMADAQAHLNSQMQIAASVIQANAPAPRAPVAEVDPADLVFEDPKTAFRMLEQRVLDGINSRQHAQNEQNRIETEFYAKHEDLMPHKDFVKYKTQELLRTMPGFNELPADKVFEIVAAQTRSELAKVRGSSASGQVLSDRPAVVAGGGGAPSPSVLASPPAQPTSFFDELMAARNKRAK